MSPVWCHLVWKTQNRGVHKRVMVEHECFVNQFCCICLQAHRKNIWRTHTDPQRCDFPLHRRARDSSSDPETASDQEVDATQTVPILQTAVPLIQAPIVPTSLSELSRREPFDQGRALTMRSGYCIESAEDHLSDPNGKRNFVAIQDKWDEMLSQCKHKYSGDFWKYFLKLHPFSRVVIDTALAGVRKLSFFPEGMEKQFPKNKRVMLSNLDCIPKFWKLVRHTSVIDVSQFNLPSGTTHVHFTFIDPIWGWLLAARRHHPADLHWLPRARNRTSAPAYGGGIQYGDCMRHAHTTIPEGSFPMFFSLHWDGTFGRGLQVVPIAVGVGNINNCDESKETCIAYMPVTPDQKQPEFRKTDKCTK